MLFAWLALYSSPGFQDQNALPTDGAWATPVTLSASRLPASQVIKDIASKTGLKLDLARNTRGLLLVAHAKDLPAHKALSGIAVALNMDWVASPDGTYTLSFNSERVAQENDAIQKGRDEFVKWFKNRAEESLSNNKELASFTRRQTIYELESNLRKLRETKPEGWVDQVEALSARLDDLRTRDLGGTPAEVLRHFAGMSREEVLRFYAGEPFRLNVRPELDMSKRVVWVIFRNGEIVAHDFSLDRSGVARKPVRLRVPMTNIVPPRFDFPPSELKTKPIPARPLTMTPNLTFWESIDLIGKCAELPLFAEGYRFTGRPAALYMKPSSSLPIYAHQLTEVRHESRLEFIDGMLIHRFEDQPWMRRTGPSSAAYDRVIEDGASFSQWMTLANDFDTEQRIGIQQHQFPGLVQDENHAGCAFLAADFWSSLNTRQQESVGRAGPIAFNSLNTQGKRTFVDIVAVMSGEQFGESNISPLLIESVPDIQKMMGFYLEGTPKTTTQEQTEPIGRDSWTLYFGENARNAKTVRLTAPRPEKRDAAK